MMWMIWDALHVVSLSCSIMVVVLLGLLSAKAGSARRAREEWWNCEEVKESSVHVVSNSMCLKSKEARAPQYPLQLHFCWGKSSREPPFWLCLIVCLFGHCYTWTCVPWVCRLCTLDRIFFWWPARVTPILASSLQGRQKRSTFKK